MKINDFNSAMTGESTFDGISSADLSRFQDMLGQGFPSVASQRSKTEVAAQEGFRLISEQAQESILERVVNKKNEMILESRGSAVKKAAEVAKDIGF